MYAEITQSIKVTVKPVYLEDQSSPAENHYVWAYHIRIENESSRTVQLINRYWRITDALGRVQEVRGAGVVGEQPYLKPGQGFRYSSGAVLETPVGVMQGSYRMVADGGQAFDAPIAPFRLSIPGMLH